MELRLGFGCVTFQTLHSHWRFPHLAAADTASFWEFSLTLPGCSCGFSWLPIPELLVCRAVRSGLLPKISTILVYNLVPMHGQQCLTYVPQENQRAC